MPKQKRKETQEEQSARFQAEVQKLIDAGELSPIEAEKRLDSLVSQVKKPSNGRKVQR